MKLNPYLTFDGNCEEAIDFYKDVFDGQIVMQMRFKDAPPNEMEVPAALENKIMHTTLEFHGCTILASDRMEGGELVKGNAHHLSVNIAAEDEAAAVFQSLADGGQVLMPFNDVFWGGKFGMLIDQFGIQWMVSSEHKPS